MSISQHLMRTGRLTHSFHRLIVYGEHQHHSDITLTELNCKWMELLHFRLRKVLTAAEKVH